MTEHQVGRRNRYEIQSQRQVNDLELTVGDVLDLLTRTNDAIMNADGD